MLKAKELPLEDQLRTLRCKYEAVCIENEWLIRKNNLEKDKVTALTDVLADTIFNLRDCSEHYDDLQNHVIHKHNSIVSDARRKCQEVIDDKEVEGDTKATEVARAILKILERW